MKLAFFIVAASAVAAQSTSAALTTQQQCVVDKCAGDNTNVSCIASCFGVPNPNDEMVSQTSNCYEECRKAAVAGSPAEDCINSCIAKFYNPAGTIVSQASIPTNSAAAPSAAAPSASATSSRGSASTASGNNASTSAANFDSKNFNTALSLITIAALASSFFI